MLDDKILRRCICTVPANEYLPFDHQNATVLPLLFSIRSYCVNPQDRELLFIHSLINLSPALRYFRDYQGLSPENRVGGLWTNRNESCGRVSPPAPCSALHESPSLRELVDRVVPLTLPVLQELKYSISTYSSLLFFYSSTLAHLHPPPCSVK
jgi:hypothetical protein